MLCCIRIARLTWTLASLDSQASRQIVEKYYSRLTLDFATNKRIADEIAIIPSKRLRNKIAGFTTVRFRASQGSERVARALAVEDVRGGVDPGSGFSRKG